MKEEFGELGEDLLAGGSGGDGDDDDAGSAARAPPLMILLPFLVGEAYAPPSAAPAMDPSSRIPLGVPRLRNRSRRFARRPHLFLIHLRLPPPPGRTVRAVLAARRERSATATAAAAAVAVAAAVAAADVAARDNANVELGAHFGAVIVARRRWRVAKRRRAPPSHIARPLWLVRFGGEIHS